MNNFKNNLRRNRYRSNGDRNFKKRNGNGHKINGDFNTSEFKRKNPGRNNQNAPKLIEKYVSRKCPKSISLHSGHLDKPFGPLIFQFSPYFKAFFWVNLLTDFWTNFAYFPGLGL